MQSFRISELVDKDLLVHGALDLDRRPNGISPRRLPAWTRPQVPAMLDVMVRMPSGVRLIFETDSSAIAITALTTNMVTPPASKRPVVFDLEIDDHIASSSNHAGNTIYLDSADRSKFELIRGGEGCWQFNNLGTEKKHCEIWLPQNAFVELHDLRIDDGASIAISTPGTPRWIHHGSSISHCMEAEQPSQIWPAVAARQSGAVLQNLGFGGQCHLDQFVARTMRDSDADLISIKTGINIINMDSMRERIFQPLLHGFLDTIREGKADTPITLISPIYCPSAEDHPGPTIPDDNGKFIVVPGHREIREGSLTLSRVRQLIREVVEIRDDENLYYVDGLDLFAEADASDLPDDLHPNPGGYVRMGQRYAEKHLSAMVKKHSHD
ncbi:MAG: GDSL-type esterase/lipase family protein [bacterium]|nr:lipase [Gammaproteobacteria bacterium]HIL96176.1 lipase [Pseudomonadales bacterium]